MKLKFSYVEQICRHHGKRPYAYETWLKRQLNRLMRRWAKQDPENAPTQKRYRGYSD